MADLPAAEGADPDLREAKARLRTRMLRVRSGLSPKERAGRSLRIERRLLALPALQDARVAMLFLSFGAEVSTAGMFDRLAERGVTTLVPFVDRGEIHGARFQPGDETVPTSFGPLEPRRRVPVDPAAVDAVVVPGLAFDRAGYRVGYGGGFFDRFLGRLRRGAATVGVCFSAQVVDGVPRGPADRPVDWLVTEDEAIDCRRDENPLSDPGFPSDLR